MVVSSANISNFSSSLDIISGRMNIRAAEIVNIRMKRGRGRGTQRNIELCHMGGSLFYPYLHFIKRESEGFEIVLY